MSRMYRYAGACLAIGSLAWLVSLLWGDAAFDGFRPSHVGDSAWGMVNLLQLAGGLLTMVGFVGMFARQAAAAGTPGLWGYGLGATSGMIFGVGFGTVSLVALPAMSASDRQAWDFYGPQMATGGPAMLFLVADLLFIAGTLLLGWATARAGVWPSWTGWGLMASGALALLIMLARMAGMTMPALLFDVPYLLFMALGAYWGWQLLDLMHPTQMLAAASGASA